MNRRPDIPPADIPRHGVCRSSNGWIVLSLFGSEEMWKSGRVVLMCHGFTGHRGEHRRLFVRMARNLLTRDIATALVDYRGNGESSGDFSEMSLKTVRNDIRNAIEFLRERIPPESMKLGLLGYSMGGMAASLVAGDEPAGLEALALWAPVADPVETFARVRDIKITKSIVESGDSIVWNGWRIGAEFLSQLPIVKPVESLVRARRPVLILQAKDDDIVTPMHSEAYQKALTNAQVPSTLEMLSSGGHGFDDLGQEAILLERTAGFFDKHLPITSSSDI